MNYYNSSTMSNTGWSAQKREVLKQELFDGKSIEQLANHFNRDISSVQRQLAYIAGQELQETGKSNESLFPEALTEIAKKYHVSESLIKTVRSQTSGFFSSINRNGASSHNTRALYKRTNELETKVKQLEAKVKS